MPLQCSKSSSGWHSEVEIIAGSGTSNGLPIHADANDCLVFQIDGAKRWSFHEPTRSAPLRSSKIFPHRYDVFPATQPSSEMPVLKVEVKAGDSLIYPEGGGIWLNRSRGLVSA